jgi:hypothetical protein
MRGIVYGFVVSAVLGLAACSGPAASSFVPANASMVRSTSDGLHMLPGGTRTTSDGLHMLPGATTSAVR